MGIGSFSDIRHKPCPLSTFFITIIDIEDKGKGGEQIISKIFYQSIIMNF